MDWRPPTPPPSPPAMPEDRLDIGGNGQPADVLPVPNIDPVADEEAADDFEASQDVSQPRLDEDKDDHSNSPLSPEEFHQVCQEIVASDPCFSEISIDPTSTDREQADDEGEDDGKNNKLSIY